MIGHIHPASDAPDEIAVLCQTQYSPAFDIWSHPTWLPKPDDKVDAVVSV